MTLLGTKYKQHTIQYLGYINTRAFFTFCLFSLIGIFAAQPAHAGLFDIFDEARFTISDIAQNMVESSSGLPFLIASLAYLLGLLFAATGILKLKEHVENPTQVPLRISIIRFLVGGGLFALPIVYESMANLISGGEELNFEAQSFGAQSIFSGFLGGIAGVLGDLGISENINYVLGSILDSIKYVPSLVAAGAYLLGLLFGMAALLKLREHVENPDQVMIKEPVIRFAVGAALLAIPSIYEAMQNAITGDNTGGVAGVLSLIGGIAGIIDTIDRCSESFGEENSIGVLLCKFTANTGAFPAFLSAIAYVFGLFLGVWGVLKIKEHVQNPQQVDIWQGVSRLIAGGAFFSLSFVTETIKNTVAPESVTDIFGDIIGILGGIIDILGDIFGEGSSTPTCQGLDGALMCVIFDVFNPLLGLLNFFGFVAGVILIMIGISRLMKTAQDGPRGPGGLGTLMTFVVGGLLISYLDIEAALTTTVFGADTPWLQGIQLMYAEGLSETETNHIRTTILAVLRFMVVVGAISFIRGLFIIRNVAEGGGQASIMAGMTHIIGGSLAMNLGALMNAVQASLGISEFGILF